MENIEDFYKLISDTYPLIVVEEEQPIVTGIYDNDDNLIGGELEETITGIGKVYKDLDFESLVGFIEILKDYSNLK